MKAMILAAGRGERMMPLTQNMPKPMLKVQGKPLLQHHIEQLKVAGIVDIVINHAWCGNEIIRYFSDGKAFGVNITYSDESTGALETAGGIAKALPLLAENADDTFLVVNGDVFCQLEFSHLPRLTTAQQACLWLVDNPKHNPNGDFCLANGKVTNIENTNTNINTLTFSGIALYKAAFFNHIINNEEKLPLGPLLRKSAEQGQLAGIKIETHWTDVGTPERLTSLNNTLSSSATN